MYRYIAADESVSPQRDTPGANEGASLFGTTPTRSTTGTDGAGVASPSAHWSNSGNVASGDWWAAPMCAPAVFWDKEEGWLQFWNPHLGLKQVLVRNRDSAFYAFDCMRSLAFFWVCHVRVTEGLGVAYDDIDDYVTSSSVFRFLSAQQGMTVFFVISGFLNLFTIMRMAAFAGETVISWKTCLNFLFRRLMHLLPPLYLSMIILWIFASLSNNETTKEDLLDGCSASWWENLVLVQNFSSFIGLGSCFGSSWIIGAEWQFYLTSVPLYVLYSFNKYWGAAATAFCMIACVILRTIICDTFATHSLKDFNRLVNQAFYTRADAYLMGMLFYMCYENVIKPFKSRSYSAAAHLRNVTDADNVHKDTAEGHVDINAVDRLMADRLSSTIDFSDAATMESIEFDPGFFGQRIQRPWMNNWLKKKEEYGFLHAFAPSWLMMSMYVCWAMSIFFVITELLDIFVSVTYFWEDWFSSRFIHRSYSYFITAGSTCGWLFFAMEGTILPVAAITELFLWYPLGNITYTSYLMSVLVSYVIGNMVLANNDYEMVSFNSQHGIFAYCGLTVVIITLSLGLGFLFTIFWEKPFVNLAKTIDFLPSS